MVLEHIKDSDKIWIFPSSEPLDIDTSNKVLQLIDEYLRGWKAHGKDLRAYSQILENRFLLIGLDQNFEMASGCSIDSMVRKVGEIESTFKLNLRDRSQVYYITENGTIQKIHFAYE